MGLSVWNVIVILLMWTYVWLVIIWTTGRNHDSTKSMDSHSNHRNCEPPTPPSDGCIGAVYLASNNKLGNWVIVNCIQPDGTLVFNNTINTRGNGSSKFFQYSLLNNIITGDNFLFVANSGSDSVSMFSIDPQSPEKLTFVTSVSSQGDFPACLAYSSALKLLCVVNAGIINNVACFKVTPTDLTPLPNTVKSVGKSDSNPPPFVFDEAASDIIFTAKSNLLIVSVKGKSESSIWPPGSSSVIPGSIVVFPVLSQGKLLGDPVINNITNFHPEQLNLIPTTIENCNNNQQNMIYSAFTYDNNPHLGLFVVPPSGIIDTTSVVGVRIFGNGGTGWSKFSPRTGLLYTTNIDSSQLTETRIECLDDGRLNGTVVNQYPLYGFGTDVVITSLPTGDCGDHLYTLDKANNPVSQAVIYVVSLSNTPGNVTLIQQYVHDNDIIVAQTGQPLKGFSQGMAAFVREPQSIGCDHYHPCD